MGKTIRITNRDHDIILQLYYLNKMRKTEVPRLPVNDFRRPVQVKKNALSVYMEKAALNTISLRKSLVRIAALW